ncbi:chromobox protein homolog 8-like [Dendronephthya gigantea]|uniref:chromobox protein homolog 8-like n=1 Tax=Dendronephthya gigantea TaxID=151771 RepID=UPI00106D092C|nr:chromobox protein homolog 8-like [Dendronephthya gigantea]
MATNTRERQGVPYFLLNKLSTVDIVYDETKRKKIKKTKIVGIFEAERVIARRKVNKEVKYLVKWKDYSSFESTWEPEHHISRASLRYFENPKPHTNDVIECVDRLRKEVVASLKHRWPEQKLTVEFRHDVYNYLFGGKGKAAEQKSWTLFEEQDFVNCGLPNNWNCRYDKHGDGVKMLFPVKMRKFLGRSAKCFVKEGESIVEAPRAYTEKISINFIKVAS